MSKGKELTPKQKAFCDENLIDLNRTRAYKAVYKSVKSDAAARVNASRLLTNANAKEYIAEKMKKIQSEKTADLEEVIQFFSSVMRGEVKDQFDLDTAISDRLSAGRELMRWYEKADGEEKETGGITIINNIPRPEGADGGD